MNVSWQFGPSQARGCFQSALAFVHFPHVTCFEFLGVKVLLHPVFAQIVGFFQAGTSFRSWLRRYRALLALRSYTRVHSPRCRFCKGWTRSKGFPQMSQMFDLSAFSLVVFLAITYTL